MSASVKLGIETIIGTGDALDSIMLIPLISQWRVPTNCLVVFRGEKCDAPLSRLYVLREPVEGHKILGICEGHHKELSDRSEPSSPVEPQAAPQTAQESPPGGSGRGGA